MTGAAIPDSATCPVMLTYAQARGLLQSLKAGRVVFANDDTAPALEAITAAITATEDRVKADRARAGAFDELDLSWSPDGWKS